MMPPRPAWFLLATAVLALIAPAASACPYCSMREQGGIGTYVILGAMILFPFVVVAVVVPVVRRLLAGRPAESTPSGAIREVP